MLPRPVALASGHEVARRLDLDGRQAQRLTDSGLLGPVYRSDNSTLVQVDHLDRLAARPFVRPPHPAALVLRVRPARPDPDDAQRPVFGWHAELPQAVRWDGVRGWWNVRDPDGVELLVVVVSTFVVEVLTVRGYTTGAQDKRRFDVVEAGDDGEPFRGARLRTPRGGSTYLLQADAG